MSLLQSATLVLKAVTAVAAFAALVEEDEPPINDAVTQEDVEALCAGTLASITVCVNEEEAAQASLVEHITALTELDKLTAANQKELDSYQRDLDACDQRLTQFRALQVPLLQFQVFCANAARPAHSPASAGESKSSTSHAAFQNASRASNVLLERLKTVDEPTAPSKFASLFQALAELIAPTAEDPLNRSQVDSILKKIAAPLARAAELCFPGSIDPNVLARFLSPAHASLELLLLIRPSVSTNNRSMRVPTRSLEIDDSGQLVQGDSIASLISQGMARNDIAPTHTGADIVEALRLFALVFKRIDPQVHDAITTFLLRLDVLTKHLTNLCVQQLGTQNHVTILRALFQLVSRMIVAFRAYARSPEAFDLGLLNPLKSVTAAGNMHPGMSLPNEIYASVLDLIAALREVKLRRPSTPLPAPPAATPLLPAGGGGGTGFGTPRPHITHTMATDANGVSLGHPACSKFKTGKCTTPTTSRTINGATYDGCSHFVKGQQEFRVHQ